MSYDIGELVGTVRMDTAQADRALTQLPSKAKAAGTQTAAAMQTVTKSTDEIGKGADRAGTAFVGFGKKFKDAFATITGFRAADAVISFFRDSISAASDLNETINKTDVVFGNSAASVKEWGQNAATSLGLSTGAALDVASTFGNLFTQLGFTSEAASDLSMNVVQMSADLGSFNNMPTAEVATRISAAFRGEYDALQQLIPGITNARVEQEAMAMSGKNTAKELTNQEKAMAVLAIVSGDGAKAMGDFARTSDGFANQQKIMAARLEDTQAAIGARLLPVMQQLMDLFGAVGIPALEAFGAALGAVGSVIGPVASFIATIPGPVLAMAAAFAVIQKYGGLGAILSHIGDAAKGLVGGFRDSASGAVTFGSALSGLAKIGAGVGAAFLLNEVFSAWQANARHNAEATQIWTDRTEDLATAINDAGGAWDDNAENMREAQITGTGMFERLVQGGISYGLALKALKGDGEAVAQVQALMLDNPAFTEQDIALVGVYGSKFKEVAKNAQESAMAEREMKLAADENNAAMERQAALGGEVGSALSNITSTAGNVGDALSGAFNLAADAAGKFSSKLKLDEFKRQLEGITTPTQDIENALSAVGSAADEASTRIEFFGIRLNELNGINITAEQATKLINDQVRNLKEGFEEATKATEGNVEALIDQSGALDTASEAGSNLFDIVQDYRGAYDVAAQSAKDAAIANGDVAGSLGAAQTAAQGVRDRFLETAAALGINGDEALALADHYGILEGIKLTDKNFKVTAEEKQAREALEAVIGTGVPDKMFIISGDKKPAAAALSDIIGTIIPGKLFGISTDPNPALGSIGRVQGTNISPKSFTMNAIDLASSVVNSLIGKVIPPKSFAITASDAASGLINRIIGTVIPNKSFSVTANLGAGAAAALGIASGGQVGRAIKLPGYAVGGRLPGNPPADSRVDNLLGFTHGQLFGLRSREWVVDEKTADYYGDRYFRDLALRRLPKQGYADGGRIGGASSTVSLGQGDLAVRVTVGAGFDGELSQLIARHARAEVEGGFNNYRAALTKSRGQAWP